MFGAVLWTILVPTGLSARELVMACAGGGQGNRGVLLRVDSETGDRTLLSDFGDPGQGPLGQSMRRVASENDGFLVVDPFVGTDGLGALFRVDGTTGQRQLLSDLGDPGQGPTGSFPIGVAVEASGSILVTDFSVLALFRIDPSTGERTILSDFSDPGQGPLGGIPIDAAIDSTGRVLVADQNAGTGVLGAIFEVDVVTGARTILSDFGDPGQGPVDSVDSVVVDADDGILVVSTFGGSVDLGAIYRVEEGTGNRTLIADFGDEDLGTLYNVRPATLAADAAGILQVVTLPQGFGTFALLISVDPATGQRTLLSDFGDSGQGAEGSSPLGIVDASAVIFFNGFESGDTGAWSSASDGSLVIGDCVS